MFNEKREARVFRNQILLSDREISIDWKSCATQRMHGLYVHHCSNVPVITAGDCLLLGWAWDCESGEPVVESQLQMLTQENFVESTVNFSGRYIALLPGPVLFSDACSSFGIFFKDGLVSTNLSLLCSQLGIKTEARRVYSAPEYLPPLSAVDGISKMSPGQYLDLRHGHSAKSISNYLQADSKPGSIESMVDNVITHLHGSALGITKLVQQDFRLMLTGGKDSRLSLSALYGVVGSELKAFTHKKGKFLNDSNDIKIPASLAKTLNFNHQFTLNRSRSSDFNIRMLYQHSHHLAGDQQAGSMFYYYENGNMAQLREEFLIDNFYELGRMHLHGHSWMPTAEDISRENVSKAYVTSDESYDALFEHMVTIAGDRDLLDVFYFIKLYSNYSCSLEILDFSHTPLLFCNSLYLFRALLNVPEELRAGGEFHQMLLNASAPVGIAGMPCNPDSNTLRFRFKRRAQARVESYLGKRKVRQPV